MVLPLYYLGRRLRLVRAHEARHHVFGRHLRWILGLRLISNKACLLFFLGSDHNTTTSRKDMIVLTNSVGLISLIFIIDGVRPQAAGRKCCDAKDG